MHEMEVIGERKKQNKKTTEQFLKQKEKGKPFQIFQIFFGGWISRTVTTSGKRVREPSGQKQNRCIAFLTILRKRRQRREGEREMVGTVLEIVFHISIDLYTTAANQI